MSQQLDRASTMGWLLQTEGVTKGSVWRYFSQADDEEPSAMVDVTSVIWDQLEVAVYPRWPGPYGNRTPEMQNLDNIRPAGFRNLIFENRLRPV